MAIDLDAVKNPQVRVFLSLFLSQRQCLRDFFVNLPDDKFDYRMVDTPERKSDSPRESLVHILETQRVFFNGIGTGTVEFKPQGTDPNQTKAELLAEMDRLDQEMFDYVNREDFDLGKAVKTPWGDMTAENMLWSIREHDILHVGWNLAIMDHLNMPRYPSLTRAWG